MRIALIAISNSVHAAKWISLIADQGWDLHFLSSIDFYGLHPLVRNVTNWISGPFVRWPGIYGDVHDREYPPPPRGRAALRSVLRHWPRQGDFVRYALKKMMPVAGDRVQWATDIIRMIEPDIVHSMEFQHGGALALEVRQRFGPGFPRWIATNWGSDVYLYGRLAKHRETVQRILQNCDYYSCECERDVTLARSFGLRGKVLPVVPNAGGLDIHRLSFFRQPGSSSSRRVIAVKGYHWTMHRAQVALRAIEMCADVLKGYRVKVYSPMPRYMTELQAQLIAQSTGLDIELMTQVSHHEMLTLHGQARISISLSISDGLCTSFTEALAMGSFPIQSATACADEWITDGVSGFLVPAEEPEIIAERLRRAVLDDALVDRAAEINAEIAATRLNHQRIRDIVIHDYYEYVFGDRSRSDGSSSLDTAS
jgi:glycosyltransferase involved in cell wall biosynthesis